MGSTQLACPQPLVRTINYGAPLGKQSALRLKQAQGLCTILTTGVGHQTNWSTIFFYDTHKTWAGPRLHIRSPRGRLSYTVFAGRRLPHTGLPAWTAISKTGGLFLTRGFTNKLYNRVPLGSNQRSKSGLLR